MCPLCAVPFIYILKLYALFINGDVASRFSWGKIPGVMHLPGDNSLGIKNKTS
jgi:hypothetical protein